MLPEVNLRLKLRAIRGEQQCERQGSLPFGAELASRHRLLASQRVVF